jgi:hypothetical protein
VAAAVLAATASWATPASPARPVARPAATGLKPEDFATAAAEKWLALIDAAKYAEAWDASAKVFQDSVARDEFTSGEGNQQAQLGRVVSRVRKSIKPRDPVPGAPEQYLVLELEYTTDFTKQKTTESVAVAHKGNVWRVVGYQVSPR